MGRHQSLAAVMIKGAIAGAVATWVMDKVTTYIYEHQPPDVREIEKQVTEGKGAYGVAAEKLARVAHIELD